MYSSDTINIAAENKRKNRQPEYCVRRPFKVCDGCVEATLGITTVTPTVSNQGLGHYALRQRRVPRITSELPHVCGSDGFIFISVAHLSFLHISNAVDREIKLEMWNATCVSFD